MVFHARLGEDGRKFKFQFVELFAPQVLLALPLGELAKIGYSEPIFD